MKNILTNPHVAVYLAAWRDYRKEVGEERDGITSVWRRKSDVVAAGWEGLMMAALSDTTWLCLRLVIERLNDIRQLWLTPGGYFFTRGGNMRRGTEEYLRRIRKSKRPSVTANMADRLTEAERLFEAALDCDDKLYQSGISRSDLDVIIIALAGSVSGGPVNRSGVPLFRGGKFRKETVNRLAREWNTNEGI